MKLNIYSVYDQKAKVFNAPFFMHSDNEAIRGLQTMVNTPDSPLAKFPEDYTLYNLGTFDDGTGECVGVEEDHKVVVKAIALIDTDIETRVKHLERLAKAIEIVKTTEPEILAAADKLDADNIPF